MKYEFKKANSTVQPPIIDKTSSAIGVYYRKNIVEKTDKQENVYYEYDEILLPRNGEFQVDFEIEDLDIYAGKLQEFIDIFNEKEKQARITEIKAQLDELDKKSIRPLRAGETERIDELENEAIKLRAELWDLQK